MRKSLKRRVDPILLGFAGVVEGMVARMREEGTLDSFRSMVSIGNDDTETTDSDVLDVMFPMNAGMAAAFPGLPAEMRERCGRRHEAELRDVARDFLLEDESRWLPVVGELAGLADTRSWRLDPLPDPGSGQMEDLLCRSGATTFVEKQKAHLDFIDFFLDAQEASGDDSAVMLALRARDAGAEVEFSLVTNESGPTFPAAADKVLKTVSVPVAKLDFTSPPEFSRELLGDGDTEAPRP